MALRLLVACLLVGLVAGDLYLHAPPGSNDRNRERNDNRNNGNRMFDSQNNNKGGYPWRGDPTMRGSLDYDRVPDPLVYYPGSYLRIEWTAQHACGPNPNVQCNVILQYGCDDDFPGLRDGAPQGTLTDNDDTYQGYKRLTFLATTIEGTGTAQNQDGTERIPFEAFPNDRDKQVEFYYEGARGGMEFGMHEGVDWYKSCTQTQRNKGLYTSDQQLNGNDATKTRQNPGGNRNGLECPEERDYYPYWRPANWRDIAVLVSDKSFCEYFKENSQNVKDVHYCKCDSDCRARAENNLIPISETPCEAAGGTWKVREALGDGAPECLLHGYSRDNHLGNVAPVDSDGNPIAEDYQPETAHYVWKLPSRLEGRQCVIRARYNISTGDYPTMAHTSGDAEVRLTMFNVSHNCPRRQNLPVSVAQGIPLEEDLTGLKPHCQGILDEDRVPLFERPYIDLFGNQKQLAIALNTDQTGRTFQDRTYVFKVAKKSAGLGRVFNLNLRGRRGNIVQAYPSVEYDFTPNFLEVTEDDYVHIQIHGSDFNAAKNANDGEGWRFSDRANLVQVSGDATNYPLPPSKMTMFNEKNAKLFALLGQSNCALYYYNGNDDERTRVQNQADNCAQLNRAPNRFPQNPADGLVRFSPGRYYYTSTRNNNFSNRAQKAQLIVKNTSSGLSTGEAVAVAFGSIAAAGIVVGGVLYYGKKHPQSCSGACFRKGARAVKGTNESTSAPDMEYVRH